MLLVLGLVALASARPLYLPLRGVLTPQGALPVRGPLRTQEALVPVNRAAAADLEGLPGIGASLAARIVSHREAHGPFFHVDDLAKVSGIGRVRVDGLRALVSVDVETNANAGARGEKDGVEKAPVVGGHPEPAAAEADEPTGVDQKIHAE